MPRIIRDDPNPYRRQFKAYAPWNCNPRVTDDHRLFRYLPEFAGWTKEHHAEHARNLADLGAMRLRQADRLAEKALAEYGSHGSLIAGCVRYHFPEPVKCMLRRLYFGSSETFDRSIAHWRAAGRYVNTWRAMRETL